MAYVAVDKNGSEWIFEYQPWRRDEFWVTRKNYIELPKGSCKKLTGVELTWEDEAVKLDDILNIKK